MLQVRRAIAEAMVSAGAAAGEGLALYVGGDGLIDYVMYHPRSMLDLLRRHGTHTPALLPAVRGYILVARRDDGRAWNAAEVMMSAAVHGYGPLMYDLVMQEEGALAPDRSMVSPDARRVWSYYLTRRPDVEARPFDDARRPMTPPELDDATLHAGAKAGPLNHAYFPSGDAASGPLRARHAKVWPALAKAGMDDERMHDVGQQFFSKV